MSDDSAVNRELEEAVNFIHQVIAAVMQIELQRAEDILRLVMENDMEEGIVAAASAFHRFRYELERAKLEAEARGRRTGNEPIGFPPISEHQRRLLKYIRAKAVLNEVHWDMNMLELEVDDV